MTPSLLLLYESSPVRSIIHSPGSNPMHQWASLAKRVEERNSSAILTTSSASSDLKGRAQWAMNQAPTILPSDLLHSFPFSQIILGAPQTEPFLSLGFTIVTPLIGEGPLALIHAALLITSGDEIAVFQIDKGLDETTLPCLVSFLGSLFSGDVLLFCPPIEQQYTPGRYKRSCKRPLERALLRGHEQPRQALRGLRVEHYDIEGS